MRAGRATGGRRRWRGCPSCALDRRRTLTSAARSRRAPRSTALPFTDSLGLRQPPRLIAEADDADMRVHRLAARVADRRRAPRLPSRNRAAARELLEAVAPRRGPRRQHDLGDDLVGLERRWSARPGRNRRP